ncbi:MAG: hypothetical protein ACKPKJ_15320 [Dolichospermum sp.]
MDNQRTDQPPSLFQDLQRHIYDQWVEIAVDLVFPVLATFFFAYTNNFIKNNIAYLKQIAEKIQSNKKNRPTFSSDQQAEIKGYMRAMLVDPDIDNVSLFFLDNPCVQDNGLIKADSFTLWIAAKKHIRNVTEPNNELSFAFVSEEINRLAEDDQKIASYDKVENGRVCLVWLRGRRTTKYKFYRTEKFGFLLIEKVGNEFRLFNNIKNFFSRKSVDYLDYCNRIDQIIESAT